MARRLPKPDSARRRPGRKPPEPPPAAASETPALLQEYSAKRTFKATPEPAPGIVPASAGPLLFVVQQHSARRLHYDFRLELDGVLKSWAVPKGPSLDPNDKRLAVQTEDHPYEYASFEGVIPRGQYGAGEVIVWDCGVYSPDEDGEYLFHDREQAQRRARAGLENGKLSLTLRGEKLKGSFALVRGSDGKNWLLIKHKDRFAAQWNAAERNRSVLSGVTVEEIAHRSVARIPASRLVPSGATERLPAKLAPMMAVLGEVPFNHADWMWEPKLDGYRLLVFIDDRGVRFQSRRAGLDLTSAFPALVEELALQWVSGMILDGELVAFDSGGRPSFSALQARVQLRSEREIAAADRDVAVVLYCFDLLHFAGVDLRGMSYADRRRYLAQCLLPSAHVQLVHAAQDGPGLYEAALALGFEGAMAKRKDSRYEPGRRSGAWLKIKSTHSAEFVIGGYTQGKGSRAPLGALLLGYWSGGRLQYCGNVGTGFDDRTLAMVEARCRELRTDVCPFAERPPLRNPTEWLRPELVAEVRFQDWTPDGYLRAPVFLRLRDDIDPGQVRRRDPAPTASGATPATAHTPIDEVLRQLDDTKAAFTLAVGAHRIRLTHLDRVYWPADAALQQPALTKRDLLRYLAQVSPASCRIWRTGRSPWSACRRASARNAFSRSIGTRHCPNSPRPSGYFRNTRMSGTIICCATISRPCCGLRSRARSNSMSGIRGPGRVRMRRGRVPTTRARSSRSNARCSTIPITSFSTSTPTSIPARKPPGAEPEFNTLAFEKGKEVAFRLRELLQAMGLEPMVKTSGKTGLHVFVPIERRLDFDAARQVCNMVGRHLLRRHPKDITMEWSIGEANRQDLHRLHYECRAGRR